MDVMKKLMLAFLALVAAAGCGLEEPLLLSEDPEIEKIRRACARPKAERVLVAPVEIAIRNKPKEGEFIPAIDRAALGRETVEIIRKVGLFREVRPEGKAASSGADLRLRLRITGALGKYKGANDSRIVQHLLWWFVSPIVSWFIADEDYVLYLTAEVEVEDAQSGTPVWKDALEVSCDGSLDDFQKGLDMWDLFAPGRGPATCDPEDVTETLGPHLYRRFNIALARRLSADLPEQPTDVCVLLRTAGEGGEEKFAKADTQKFTRAFRTGRGRTEIVDLTGKSVAGLKKSLSELGERRNLRIRDLVFYFAGNGTLAASGKNRAYPSLVLLAGKKSTSLLRVDWLLGWIRSVPAESHAVVLDAGFQSGKARWLRPRKPVSPDAEIVLPMGKNLPGLLWAGMETNVSKEFGGGVFTHVMLNTLDLASDRNKDGKLTLKEVYGKVTLGVARASMKLGGEGIPFLLGDGVLFRVPRGTSAKAPKKSSPPKKKAATPPKKRPEKASPPAKKPGSPKKKPVPPKEKDGKAGKK
jgi:hypothetical protein